MKRRINPNLIAMMAACAVVTNVATIGAAHAQGMPPEAQQLIQTMRPMQISQATPDQTQTAAAPQEQTGDGSAYGGMSAASASGRRDGGGCSVPNCNVFFGQ
ncbi:hypothetical protein AWB79_00777 [Caballeronia hypogeia]|uniref:Lipoprotein n=1 Tax=Caballeronia hypogeia TaxID=1777140 RepID=A0A157ZGT3_9BURK|nr:hypothetical protein [Caballeronia hypogeia]SAK44127.1 hypothetical protein AWB79_00777 [Caballeronia hypogeia]